MAMESWHPIRVGKDYEYLFGVAARDGSMSARDVKAVVRRAQSPRDDWEWQAAGKDGIEWSLESAKHAAERAMDFS